MMSKELPTLSLTLSHFFENGLRLGFGIASVWAKEKGLEEFANELDKMANS